MDVDVELLEPFLRMEDLHVARLHRSVAKYQLSRGSMPCRTGLCKLVQSMSSLFLILFHSISTFSEMNTTRARAGALDGQQTAVPHDLSPPHAQARGRGRSLCRSGVGPAGVGRGERAAHLRRRDEHVTLFFREVGYAARIRALYVSINKGRNRVCVYTWCIAA